MVLLWEFSLGAFSVCARPTINDGHMVHEMQVGLTGDNIAVKFHHPSTMQFGAVCVTPQHVAHTGNVLQKKRLPTRPT